MIDGVRPPDGVSIATPARKNLPWLVVLGDRVEKLQGKPLHREDPL